MQERQSAAGWRRSWTQSDAYTLDQSERQGVCRRSDFSWTSSACPPFLRCPRAHCRAHTLIWGRQDRATRPRVAQAVSARFGWPLHVIDDADDDRRWTPPDVFLKTLRLVLEGLRQSR